VPTNCSDKGPSINVIGSEGYLLKSTNAWVLVIGRKHNLESALVSIHFVFYDEYELVIKGPLDTRFFYWIVGTHYERLVTMVKITEFVKNEWKNKSLIYRKFKQWK
jgi:hypothetical protein